MDLFWIFNYNSYSTPSPNPWSPFMIYTPSFPCSRHIFMFDLWTRCYQWRLQAAAILADGNKLVLSTKPFEENNSLTMAVPFSNTKLRVPKGFQNILEGLARECLRSQPENIYEFGAKYFQQLIQVRERK